MSSPGASARGAVSKFGQGVGVGVAKRKSRKLLQYQYVCAEPPKADIGTAAKCPLCAKSRHSALRQRLLFDHFVGAGKQRLRHSEPECLRGFEIDDQCKFGRDLHWKVPRLFALEDAIDVAG